MISIPLVVRILKQENENGDKVQNDPQEKPQPGTSIRILSPKRTKCPEEKEDGPFRGTRGDRDRADREFNAIVFLWRCFRDVRSAINRLRKHQKQQRDKQEDIFHKGLTSSSATRAREAELGEMWTGKEIREGEVMLCGQGLAAALCSDF